MKTHAATCAVNLSGGAGLPEPVSRSHFPKAGIRSLWLLVAGLCFALAGSGLARAENDAAEPEVKPALPRLVDLGASKCIPCKMMKPILEKLTIDYAGQLEVVFIDVWEKREEGRRHGIRMIPTQIFYDAGGRELARHEGFMSESDILEMWTKLGVELKPPTADQRG